MKDGNLVINFLKMVPKPPYANVKRDSIYPIVTFVMFNAKDAIKKLIKIV
jgi:hypothetical protein